jgi:hypothetical protein
MGSLATKDDNISVLQDSFLKTDIESIFQKNEMLKFLMDSGSKEFVMYEMNDLTNIGKIRFVPIYHQNDNIWTLNIDTQLNLEKDEITQDCYQCTKLLFDIKDALSYNENVNIDRLRFIVDRRYVKTPNCLLLYDVMPTDGCWSTNLEDRDLKDRLENNNFKFYAYLRIAKNDTHDTCTYVGMVCIDE